MVNSFEKLKNLLQGNREVVDIGHNANDGLISSAESYLNLNFPLDYKVFLKEWGTLSVGPDEYYGICHGDFENSGAPDGIWFTNLARAENNLPSNMLVLKNNDGDNYHCLLVEKDSYTIIVWDVPTKEIIVNKGSDLFNYLLEESLNFIE